VENLLRAGAAVHLVSPDASPRLAALATEGSIAWAREHFETDHLHGALLAVAATNDEGLNARLVEAGRELGVLTCDASASERSEFIFGALHLGDGLTIAVFTDGEDPSRSRTTRDRIADLIADEPESEPPAID
jgi:uroporphyrin-III C-methyltransferase/precorrin-2 dehydrogenase/sirohydrochlorin ferrochelatase